MEQILTPRIGFFFWHQSRSKLGTEFGSMAIFGELTERVGGRGKSRTREQCAEFGGVKPIQAAPTSEHGSARRLLVNVAERRTWILRHMRSVLAQLASLTSIAAAGDARRGSASVTSSADVASVELTWPALAAGDHQSAPCSPPRAQRCGRLPLVSPAIERQGNAF